MKQMVIAAGALAVMWLGIGCSQPAPPPRTAPKPQVKPKPESKPEVKPEAPPEPEPERPPRGPSENWEDDQAYALVPVDVPSCDAVLKKLRRCIATKLPEGIRPTMARSMRELNKAWRIGAATSPAVREAIVSSCARTRQRLIKSLASFKCDL